MGKGGKTARAALTSSSSSTKLHKSFLKMSVSYSEQSLPDVFEKIFTSKGREHDGAVIFYLCYDLVDSVSAMMKHNIFLDRGARHISACYFSKTTSIPIVVISEKSSVAVLERSFLPWN
ncbi:disA bacterial checkpoint controller nucleotide-binding domain-containing protein [Ditylenchus destructor]|nr:disA bacterial checkpoint controller nucleotide-binding domain-containing protein [Ditylenchus destructor]